MENIKFDVKKLTSYGNTIMLTIEADNTRIKLDISNCAKDVIDELIKTADYIYYLSNDTLNSSENFCKYVIELLFDKGEIKRLLNNLLDKYENIELQKIKEDNNNA